MVDAPVGALDELIERRRQVRCVRGAADLVGHHTGAVIAVELAAAAPERAGSLVLSGPVYVDEAMRQALD